MQEGNTVCHTCFDARKNSANNFYKEKIFGRNWGVYLIPIVGAAIAIADSVKFGKDGCLYHVYRNGCHEKWVHFYAESNDLKRCYSCNGFENSYYRLFSKE